MEYSLFIAFFVGDEILVFYRLQMLFDWCMNLHKSSFFISIKIWYLSQTQQLLLFIIIIIIIMWNVR
jgi:hypothetical protein